MLIVDAYCVWIDDDEGVTWIQCSVCNNWIHELCLPTVQYVLLEQIIHDIKRGGGGGVKVNVTMTLRIMILICEQPLRGF